MRIRFAGIALIIALGICLFFAGRGIYSSRQTGRATEAAPRAGGPLPVAESSNALARPNSVPLPPSREELWSRPAVEPAFAQFADWTKRYAAAAPQEKAALEAEGVALARERLAALAILIQTNPERALELAAPHAVREAMPDAVKALLEQPVNARGDYQVIGMLPAAGVPTDLPPVIRAASIDGQQYQVFTFGGGLDFVTRQDVPLNGIAVPADLIAASSARQLLQASKLIALNPNPARLLDHSEVRELAARRAREPACSTSGQPVASRAEETAVELGGVIRSFCGKVHAEDWANAQVAAFGGGGDSLTGDGSTTGGPPLTGFDNYTTGRKRFLILRPRFADVNSTMSDAAVPGHFNSFSNFMYEMSWGKLVFAGLGAGSDATPIMLLPGNAADYDNTGLGKLYNTAKAVAQTNYGFNLGQYDFIYVVTGGQPAASYAGLGYVRGVGFHLANGYYGAGTAAHEFGHNLGLNHANFWSTGGKTMIGSGNSVEYGDGNDTMGGGGSSPQHYVSRYKNYLTWIANTDVATITSANSGTYRLYALDETDVVGSYRGLKVVRTGSQNYWVHFRQRFTGKAMLNGVQLLWTGNGNQSSLLLDTRLKDGSDNNALVIGRTFSDTSLGIHITPTGKGHTAPESMDVVVNVGSFAANQPPVAVVSASTTNAGTGQTITFNAAATDPNGDPLAYAWDFGDSDYSIDNSAATTHSFAAAGEYVVQCTVSDMKGGTARDSVLVRVGSPATFRISGHVLRLDQRGYSGVKVSADASHFGVADSDGAYTITGLGAGSYTLSALETVSGFPTFIHPFFANPATVGPSAVNMDFIVGTSAPPVTLVATGAVWKYLDTGTDQGTAWIATNFNDTAWASGPAELGYGEGDEATVISYGPDANAKYTTTYFRRTFTVANAAALTNITVSLLRDDGGIVYLNGVEIFRSNMPAGAVTYATFASGSIDDQVFFSGSVPPGILVSGTNVLAVELHQSDLTTSDASFDLSLTADSTASIVQGSIVYLSAPESGSAFTSPTNLALSAIALATSGSFTNVEFFDGAVKLGEDATVPFSFAWNGVPTGSHTLTARAKNTGGITVTSGPVSITVTLPSSAPPAVALTLISTGANWRYLAGASAAPANWATAAFSDTGWPAGNAELGFGDGGEATVIDGGPAATRYATVYFRHAFTVNDPAAVTNLTLQLKRDDGAVVYLNGLELLRDNMPLGAIAYGTLATNAADDGASFFTFALNPASLAVGSNMVAVEVHQSALNSSDLSFDLGLDALASTNRPRGVYLVSPLDGASVALPNNVTIAAQVVAGGTLGVAKVEFYGGGVKIGEDTAAPYSLAWSNPPSGAQQIFAVATDSAGGSITSAPVSILVTAPPLTTQLISSGDVWKYLDDGADPGTAWRARIFDDSDWNEGAARLGYGGDGEVTTVSYGSDANNRHVTTYFRHAFTVANPAAFTSVRLRLIRDDGAVVYLNGAEVFRSNMAAGLISANSLALLTVNAPEETTFYETVFSTAGLVAGTNVVAVEVHQAGVTSSDLGFDLALLGVKNTNAASGIYLSSPAQGADYDMPATVAISAFATSTSGVSKVEFFDGATKLGETTNAPFNFTWNSASAGSHTLTARATDNAALTMTSPPVAITVSPVTLPSASVATMFFPARSTWTYLDDGSNQGTNWTGRAFNDAAWKMGAGRFGYGYDGETTKLGTNITTHYFRKWFTVANPGQITELLFRLQRDDGAVIHLNGQEIYRSNMPTGAVNSATLAVAGVNALDENYVFETFIPTPGSGLLLGSNLVAVELHQSSATSSDAGFDLELWGYGTTEPRVYLANPPNGADCKLPVNVSIDANAWAGTGRSLSKVEFFDGAAKLGESSLTPYRWIWTNPPAGTHVLSAVATDNGGRLIGSEPATITVTTPPLTLLLVASNSVWKYLDNGSNQGTNWAQRGYNDASWLAGPAELGYNNNPVTVVSFGPSSSSKYITTYFRRWFSVADDAVITNFNFRLKRDDGAVVYLNGREVFRSNMPATAITSATLASASVGGADETTFFLSSLPATNLVAGTNLLAVEVHQNAADSSDLSFDIEVTGTGYAIYLPPPVAAITRAGGTVEISWPAAYTGWRVYATTDILTALNQWTLLPNFPVVVGGNNVLTITPSGGAQFFRLGKP